MSVWQIIVPKFLLVIYLISEEIRVVVCVDQAKFNTLNSIIDSRIFLVIFLVSLLFKQPIDWRCFCVFFMQL